MRRVGDDVDIRVEEHDPELVLDDIQRHLTTTDRALDKTREEETGIIQQKAVTGLRRYGLEYPERLVGELDVIGCNDVTV